MTPNKPTPLGLISSITPDLKTSLKPELHWLKIIVCLCSSILLLSACTTNIQDGPPQQDIDVSKIPNPTPHLLAKSRFGNPKKYRVLGVTYHVLPTARGYDKQGIASWYGTKFHGQLTSTREPYNLYAMTAANKILPLPCYARVTNLENGRQIIVKINDRGPFAPKRIIDLSYSAAKKLNMLHKGTAWVEVKTITNFNPHQPHTNHTKQRPTYKTHQKNYLYKPRHESAKKYYSAKRYQIAAFSKKGNATEFYKKMQRQGRRPRINITWQQHKKIYCISVV